MTAPVIETTAVDMPSLDAEVACEYGSDCPCGTDHPCSQAAVWRARIHGSRRATENACYAFTLLLCTDHLNGIRDSIAALVSTIGGPGLCGGCRKPVRHVSDILVEVTTL